MGVLKLHLATVDQLRDELAKRGYAVASLWQISDVQQRLDDQNEDNGTKRKLSNEDALGIMNNALGNDATMMQIYEAIDYEIDYHFEDQDDEDI